MAHGGTMTTPQVRNVSNVRRSVMKIALSFVVGSIIAIAGPACTTVAQDGHKVVPAQEVKWGPGPASIPPGAQATTLYGDPGKEGLFALRIKVPKDYHIPPHTHPKPEVVTVISGTLRLGMGEAADRSKAQALAAGSFFALPPGMAHYVFADDETVIQLNSNGPWGLNYVNPKDDPRQKTQ
jgi:quercetin dioxygenase-like cupin family protein